MPWTTVANLAGQGQRTFLPVANRMHFNGHGGGTASTLPQWRCRFTRVMCRVIASGARRLQLEWANTWTSNTPPASEVAGPNPVSLRMAVEYPAGNLRMVNGSSVYSASTAYAVGDQVRHNNQKWLCVTAGTGNTPSPSSSAWRLVRTYTVRWAGSVDDYGTLLVQPGEYRQSLPVELAEATQSGDRIAVLSIFDSGSSTGRIPYAGNNYAANMPAATWGWDWVIDYPGGMPAAGSDPTATGITTHTNANGTASGTTNPTEGAVVTRIPFPTAVTGDVAPQPCVALFGDSLIEGVGGDYRDGEPCGTFVRAMDGGPLYWRIAQGGNQAGCYVTGESSWQMSVVRRCTAVLTDLGMNDLQANQTAAQTRARMTSLWRLLGSGGAPVFAGMFTPISTSTDGWTSTGRQGQWAGGSIATTQFPGGSTSYEASVYGQVQKWLTQDGAPVDTGGQTAQLGQPGHPVERLLDWRALWVDILTGWRWAPQGYTTDGAHPTATACQLQAQYLAPQVSAAVIGGAQERPAIPAYSTVGVAPVVSVPRSLSTSVSDTTWNGSFVSYLGDSPGFSYLGFRVCVGTAVAGTSRAWALLVGQEPSKLRVLASGTLSVASAGVVGVALPGGLTWVPPGYAMALVIASGGVNGAFAGTNTPTGLHSLNVGGNGHLLAGAATTAAMPTTPVTLADGQAFSATKCRIWAEML